MLKREDIKVGNYIYTPIWGAERFWKIYKISGRWVYFITHEKGSIYKLTVPDELSLLLKNKNLKVLPKIKALLLGGK